MMMVVVEIPSEIHAVPHLNPDLTNDLGDDESREGLDDKK